MNLFHGYMISWERVVDGRYFYSGQCDLWVVERCISLRYRAFCIRGEGTQISRRSSHPKGMALLHHLSRHSCLSSKMLSLAQRNRHYFFKLFHWRPFHWKFESILLVAYNVASHFSMTSYVLLVGCKCEMFHSISGRQNQRSPTKAIFH